MRLSKWTKRILTAGFFSILVGASAFAIYFSNAQPASPEAVAALRSTAAVTVSDSADQITFMPKGTPKAGLVFYPGARVDPAAYAARLEPVAEQGYAVFIVKFPLNLAIFGVNRAGEVIAAHPEIKKWAVGGHSLGGAFASSFIASRKDVRGLILFASYPAGDLSHRTDLVAVSIYGTRDGLATVQKVEKARPTLPPQTRYIAISGGIHSFFGDYGLQSGDGQPAISRKEAAAQIVAATIAAMNEIAAR